MARSELVRVLDAYASAKNSHDVEAVLRLVAPDSWYESAGFGGRIQGTEALRGFYQALFAALPDYSGDFDSVAYGEDTTMACGRFGGTVAGDFMGLPARPGSRIAVPVTFVCTIRDGLVVSDTGYFDVATLADQAGIPRSALQPAPGDAFVTRFAEFWRAPDPALLADLVHDDMRARWTGVPDEISGLDGYQEQFRTVLALVPDLRIEVLDHVAQGDRVYIQWLARATIGGAVLEFPGVDRFRLRDGRAYEVSVVFDTSELLRAFEASAAHVTTGHAPSSTLQASAGHR